VTAKPGDKPDLEAISGPSTAPPSDPDELTEKAIKQAEQSAKRLTHTQLHHAAVNRHLTEACIARDRLEAEKNRLQGELDRLGPEYQRVKERLSNFRSTSNVAALFLVISGILVSAAAYHETFKTMILGIGYGCFACGIILTYVNSRRTA
jgi:hypothetical protein